MLSAESVTCLGVGKDAPLTSSSRRSLTTAPEPVRLTRITVDVVASATFSNPSPSFAEACSEGVPVASGATVSLRKLIEELAAPTLPA